MAVDGALVANVQAGMSGADGAVAAFEGRIGHHFQDRGLLNTALTHSSAVAAGICSARGTYERLEFLGDRVLGLIVAEMLLATFPDAAEGELSPRLARLVRKETCAEVAAELGLGDALIAGGGREQRRSLQTRNVLGDACEAVIAAIFLDGGMEAARRFISTHWRERMLSLRGPRQDAKTALQEWAQRLGKGTPSYALVDRRGPDHASTFAVSVSVAKIDPAVGEGRSRREAEQAAATAVLLREGVWKVEA
jgi:ribonuclease III